MYIGGMYYLVIFCVLMGSYIQTNSAMFVKDLTPLAHLTSGIVNIEILLQNIFLEQYKENLKEGRFVNHEKIRK